MRKEIKKLLFSVHVDGGRARRASLPRARGAPPPRWRTGNYVYRTAMTAMTAKTTTTSTVRRNNLLSLVLRVELIILSAWCLRRTFHTLCTLSCCCCQDRFETGETAGRQALVHSGAYSGTFLFGIVAQARNRQFDMLCKYLQNQ